MISGEKKHRNIYIATSISNKMTALEVLTQQMKLVTTGITEICVAHCLKGLNACNAKDYPFAVLQCHSSCPGRVFLSFSGSTFSLFLLYCSCNLTLANANTIVRAGSQGKSPCIYISMSFEHHHMVSQDSQEGLSKYSSHECCP